MAARPLVSFVNVIAALVVLCFTMSVLLEVAGAAARPAGALLGKNSLGYTLLVMINTLKRTFLVLYPPLLGILALEGGPAAVVRTIYCCFAFALLPLLMATLARKRLIAACGCFISLYSEGRNITFAIKQAVRAFLTFSVEQHARMATLDESVGPATSLFEFDVRLFMLATVIQVFYTIALFAINLVGAYCEPYGPVVYQLTGLVSALGTLIWAFALDPQLSRKFDEGKDIARTYHSLLLANWACNVFLAPLLLWFILLMIWQLSGPLCGLQNN